MIRNSCCHLRPKSDSSHPVKKRRVLVWTRLLGGRADWRYVCAGLSVRHTSPLGQCDVVICLSSAACLPSVLVLVCSVVWVALVELACALVPVFVVVAAAVVGAVSEIGRAH